jgi:hypothetical protein
MIFIHSGFRTSSTYVWSRFRANDCALAYCEIFNEQLGTMSLESISKSSPDSWASKHPDGSPYFLEYLPLLRPEGGVVGFDASFSYERFVPPGGPSSEISASEAAYVRGLIEHAKGRGKIPVLTATRSLGRVAGLKAEAPGLHVLLYRDLFQQWCSYTEQAVVGNRYFLDTITTIARLNSHDSIIKKLSALFPIEVPSERDLNTFYLFVFTHIYLYGHAASAADVILDINHVAEQASYRRDMEDLFASHGLRADLSDTKASIAFSLIDLKSMAEFREMIMIIGNIAVDAVPSGVGRQFASRVISDLLKESERHEFYVKAIRSVLIRSIEARNAAPAKAGTIRRELGAPQSVQQGALHTSDAAAADPGTTLPAPLPDEKWEEAWASVAKRPPGRAVGPDEMRAHSARVIPIQVLSDLTDIDFIILHKGREPELAHVLAQIGPEGWHMIYANEVFLVIGRHAYEPELVDPVFVPPKYHPFLRPASASALEPPPRRRWSFGWRR